MARPPKADLAFLLAEKLRAFNERSVEEDFVFSTAFVDWACRLELAGRLDSGLRLQLSAETSDQELVDLRLKELALSLEESCSAKFREDLKLAFVRHFNQSDFLMAAKKSALAESVNLRQAPLFGHASGAESTPIPEAGAKNGNEAALGPDSEKYLFNSSQKSRMNDQIRDHFREYLEGNAGRLKLVVGEFEAAFATFCQLFVAAKNGAKRGAGAHKTLDIRAICGLAMGDFLQRHCKVSCKRTRVLIANHFAASFLAKLAAETDMCARN